MVRIRVGGVLAALMVAAAVVGVWDRVDHAASQAASGEIGLTPPSQVVNTGAEVTLDVQVENVSELAAWEIRVRYDKSVLKATSFEPRNDFLGGSGRQVSCPLPSANAEETEVQVGCGTLGQLPGVAGSAVVGTLSFTAVGVGETDVEIVKVELANSAGANCCGAPVTNEAVVKVVAQGQDPEEEELPATATPNPRKLTPTIPAGATVEAPLVLGEGGDPDPVLSSGGRSGTIGSGSGDSGRVAGAERNPATSGNAVGADGAPAAGTGPGPREDHTGLLVWSVGLAVAGSATYGIVLARRARRAGK